MKKIILLTLLILSSNLFSQKNKATLIEEMNGFYNRGKIEKLEVLTNEVLSGKYGNIDNELKLTALSYSSNVYCREEYANNNPQRGYDKMIELIEYINKEAYNFENKDAYVKQLKDYLIEYLKKYPTTKTTDQEKKINSVASIDNKSSDSNSSTLENKVQSENNITNTNDKTVTLTVSGTGKTIEEAKINALRSAIEQAFGAFISSKTEILNDNLVSDEIISVTNGNIQKYDIVSQVELSKNSYAVTLITTVSISKLTSFAESKGVVIEFKGGIFGANIKLQKLNERNELDACSNIFGTFHELMQNSFDYTIKTNEPILFKEDIYSIEFNVEATTNKIYNSMAKYCMESLAGLNMTPQEIEEYNKIKKPIYKIKLFGVEYFLRNEMSWQTMNNIGRLYYYYSGNFKILLNDDEKSAIYGPDLGYIIQWNGGGGNYTKNGELTKCSFLIGDRGNKFFDQNTINKSYVFKDKNKIKYTWNQFYSLKELESISNIKIQGRGIRSYFKYGGFVIYKEKNRVIVAAPYNLKIDFIETERNGKMPMNLNDFFWKPENTKEVVFSGKENTDNFKDENNLNTIYSFVKKNNEKNNTDWFIPSKDELILAMRELYKFCYNEDISYVSSTISTDEYKQKSLFFFDESDISYLINDKIFSNEKMKKYLNGNPFNISDFMEYVYKADLNKTKYKIKEFKPIYELLLIKYIDVKP